MGTRRKPTCTLSLERTRPVSRNVTAPFNQVTESGTYYCHNTGWLYRIPDDNLVLGHSPVLHICSLDDCMLTKISEDPWIPVTKAREVCCNWDLAVNF